MTATPEHDKMAARRDEHEVVVGFLTWCEEAGVSLRRVAEFQPSPNRVVAYEEIRPDVAIAQWLDVDPLALEQEKRAILDSLRAGS